MDRLETEIYQKIEHGTVADHADHDLARLRVQVSSHPNIKVRVAPSPNGTANAKTDVGKDPTKAADVFAVPNDQLGQMADAGYINPLAPKDVENIKKNDIPEAHQASQWKGKVYGYPYTADVQFLYYNKSKLSPSDVKDWDILTKKGVVATNFGAYCDLSFESVYEVNKKFHVLSDDMQKTDQGDWFGKGDVIMVFNDTKNDKLVYSYGPMYDGKHNADGFYDYSGGVFVLKY